MPVIEIVNADITTLSVDAIVNAANSAMRGGGGVDGAIHRAAGPELLKECRAVGPCPTGSARITGAYRLPAKFVIHAVGPVWKGGSHSEAELLAACYRSAMQLAADSTVRSIAFPAISCGAYGYPLQQAANIAVATVRESLREHSMIERVVFALVDADVTTAFRLALEIPLGASGTAS